MWAVLFIALPALFFGGVYLTETSNPNAARWFVGYAAACVALGLFLALVIVSNI